MRTWLSRLALLAVATWVIPTSSAAFSWDTDGNNIDDHIEAVVQNGVAAAYENGDINARLLINVSFDQGVPSFGAYIKFDHLPTAADEQAVAALGLTTERFRYINYILVSGASFTKLQQALALPGVLRVESEPMMYPTNDNLWKVQQIDHTTYETFPTTIRDRGIDGTGVVIAVLDSGVNDEADAGSGYPGHESLQGKFLGGGIFTYGDPMLDTGVGDSENPVDGFPDFSHGSHVAGTALGTGGPTGLPVGGVYGRNHGMAPEARLVDCKVLTDAGVGPGGSSTRGIEWCIFNKDNDWGLTGADTVYSGIQVMNMSLGGLLSDSDGTDASSAAVNAAVKAGIVVCVATGNDGNTNFISSPAAADRSIACGANIDYNTMDRSDDEVASFSNEGPRKDDLDSDHFDEMKPSVCATGAGVTSVEGVLTADGTTYVVTNGTSMSTPATAGICALIIQACPGISPNEVQRILQDTAEHRYLGGKQPVGAADPYGLDPNYHPSWGWGNPNAYAAVMESMFPNQTQVIREWGEPVVGGIDVHWTTQREIDVVEFRVLRADPVYGLPGAFQQVNVAPIAPVGDPFIHLTTNRTSYTYPDTDPSLVAGEVYWYRVQWLDGNGQVHDEPAFPVCYEAPVPLATIHYSITHNALDGDLLIALGSGTDASDPSKTAEYLILPPGSAAADSIVTIAGEATTGNRRHYWTVQLTDKDAGAASFLPPSADNPWFLYVAEGGFVNRVGKVEGFSIVYHDTGGDVTYNPVTPFPIPTVQGAATTVWIPSDPAVAVNHAPVLDPVGNQEAQEGKTLEFTVTADDADGNPLTYAAPTLPPGATFNPGTQVFSWSPDYSAVATTTEFTAEFTVDDGLGGTDTETITIRLHDVDPLANLSPYFRAINDQFVIEGNTLEFKVAADDPECDSLVYAATVLPGSSAFDPGTRCFTWNTVDGDEGQYFAEFSVSDGVNPPVTERVVINIKGDIPPLLEPCQFTTILHNGVSSLGSSDLGTNDVDSVFCPLPLGAPRLIATLSWPGVSDLDIYVYDQFGNVLNSGASLSNPESFILDNIDPGTLTFQIVGYLVPVDENWTLTLEKCEEAAVPVTLSHFASQPDEGMVRLEWATGSEVNHTGFHIYRSAQEVDGYNVISQEMIRGDGVYQFVDRDPLAVEAATAYYKLGAIGRDGQVQMLGPWKVDLSTVRPIAFRLAQNVPNPYPAAAGRTVIRFSLPAAADAKLEVFDVQGRLVQVLAEGRFERGENEINWNGTDFRGSQVASGVYFYRLEVPGSHVQTRQMVIVR